MANPRHKIVRFRVDLATGICYVQAWQNHYFDGAREFMSDEVMRFLSDPRLLEQHPSKTAGMPGTETTKQSRCAIDPTALCLDTIDRARRSSTAAIRAAASAKVKPMSDAKIDRQSTRSDRPRHAGKFERLVQRNWHVASFLQDLLILLRDGGHWIPVSKMHRHLVDVLVRSGVRNGEYPFNTQDLGLQALRRWLQHAECASAEMVVKR